MNSQYSILKKIFVITTLSILLITGLVLPGASSAQQELPAAPDSVAPSVPTEDDKARLAEQFGKLPLYFIENGGQLDSRVAYYIQGNDKTIYFTSEGLTFALTKPHTQDQSALPQDDLRADPAESIEEMMSPSHYNLRRSEAMTPRLRHNLKLDFVNARPGALPIGQQQSEAVFSYFKGQEDEWKSGLRSYQSLVYRDLWPGIDLVYDGSVNRMKYSFVVKPGADPSQIELAYRGADEVRLNEAGEMEVRTSAGMMTDERPVSYQEVEGRQVEVGTTYRLDREEIRNPLSSIGNRTSYGFALGEYDRSRELVIDPAVLVYCGYLGGSSNDTGTDIAIDSAGNAYVAGYTFSSEATFPETVGPDLTFNAGSVDAFVAKVRADGTGLIYCGYIGGSGNDFGYDIAVDNAGNAYVLGDTLSSEATFPETVGPDLTSNGAHDAFVTKVRSDGTGLVYCGYLGGSAGDFGGGIAVDNAGNAYVTGSTGSTEVTFPETVGPDLTFNGDRDAFVAKVRADGTGLIYCGYLGGSGNDIGYGLAVDSAGNAYVQGNTNSTEATFPETVGPDLTYNGSDDAFVAKVRSSSLSQTSQSFSPAAGTGSVSLIASGTWTATSNNLSWLNITSGSSGTGNGTVQFSVAANPAASARTGTLTINGDTFTVLQGGNFPDVPPSHPFYTVIGKLYARNVTAGCGSGNYCPDAVVTREQMAVFILKGMGEFNPPTPPSQRFNDVPPASPFYSFIDRMAVLQITAGCSGAPPLYCPANAVTREQMAAFIIRALHNPGYIPPTPASQRFNDVPPSNPFYAFIEEMAVRQITAGCSSNPPQYCPGAPVTRAQMAAFLVRAFNL